LAVGKLNFIGNNQTIIFADFAEIFMIDCIGFKTQFKHSLQIARRFFALHHSDRISPCRY
jgi:hypothetical protein